MTWKLSGSGGAELLVIQKILKQKSWGVQGEVLPSDVTSRISIEAGVTLGWEKYIGQKGKAVGIDRFGSSAPAGKIYKELGLTVENLIATAKSL